MSNLLSLPFHERFDSPHSVLRRLQYNGPGVTIGTGRRNVTLVTGSGERDTEERLLYTCFPTKNK